MGIHGVLFPAGKPGADFRLRGEPFETILLGERAMKKRVFAVLLAVGLLAAFIPAARADWWDIEINPAIAIKDIPLMPVPWKEYPEGSKEQLALQDWMRQYLIIGLMETPEGKAMGEEYLSRIINDCVMMVDSRNLGYSIFHPDVYGLDKGKIVFSEGIVDYDGRRGQEKATLAHEGGHAIAYAFNSPHGEAHAEWLRRQIGLVYGFDYFTPNSIAEDVKAYAVDACAKIVGHNWYWNYFKRTDEQRKLVSNTNNYYIDFSAVWKRFEENQDVISWEAYFSIFQSFYYSHSFLTNGTAQKVVDYLYYIADNPKFNPRDKMHVEIREFFDNVLSINPILIRQFLNGPERTNMIDPAVPMRERVTYLAGRIARNDIGEQTTEALKSLINTTYIIPALTSGGDIDKARRELAEDLPDSGLREVTDALNILDDAKQSAAVRATLLAAAQAEELLFSAKGYAIRANEFNEALLAMDDALYAANNFSRAFNYSAQEQKALADANAKLKEAGQGADALYNVDSSLTGALVRDADFVYWQTYMQKMVDLNENTPSKARALNVRAATHAGAIAKKEYLEAELAELTNPKKYEPGFAGSTLGKEAIAGMEKEIAAAEALIIENEPNTPNLHTASEWAHNAINYAVADGYVLPEMQDNYGNVITRAEFCRMAVKWVEYHTGKNINEVMAEKGVWYSTATFTDTQERVILYAHALGIVNGTGNNLFTPNGSLTREQAATMLRNVCNVLNVDIDIAPEQGFVDIDMAGDWAVDSINFCRNAKIMNGTSEEPLTFSPKGLFTREQSIMTFFNIDVNKLPKK